MRVFVLGPKNEAVATGEKPYKAKKGSLVFQTLFALSFIVIGIGVFVGTVIAPWFESTHLKKHGVVTQATIIDRLTGKCEDDDGDAYTCYKVIYRFEHIEPNGEPRAYEEEAFVHNAEYQRMESGTKVDVLYDSKNPTRSWLRDFAPNNFTLFNAMLGSFFSIMFAGSPIFFLVGSLKQYSFERKLEKYGQLIYGVVRSCKGDMDSDDDFQVTLQYSFRSPSGHEITNETTQTANHLNEDTLPYQGTTVAILYVNDKVYKVL